jgi:hypothetical protein
MAAENSVTVFEREERPGGALRQAGRAPLFQGVVAEPRALDTFIGELERAGREKGVVFRYGSAVEDLAALVREFDLIVVATGAKYRLGVGPLVAALLDAGWGQSGAARRLFESTRIRNWLYYRARVSAMPGIARIDGAKILVIGDARSPGKMRDAIASAFDAARIT